MNLSDLSKTARRVFYEIAEVKHGGYDYRTTSDAAGIQELRDAGLVVLGTVWWWDEKAFKYAQLTRLGTALAGLEWPGEGDRKRRKRSKEYRGPKMPKTRQGA